MRATIVVPRVAKAAIPRMTTKPEASAPSRPWSVESAALRSRSPGSTASAMKGATEATPTTSQAPMTRLMPTTSTKRPR